MGEMAEMYEDNYLAGVSMGEYDCTEDGCGPVEFVSQKRLPDVPFENDTEGSCVDTGLWRELHGQKGSKS